MELRRLRYFATVADLLNFSRAAERLHISQSALSRQIQILERELRVQLFDRIGRGIALTPAGEDLLARCHAILQDVSAIHSRAGELAGGTKGILRIGATPQTFESLVSRVLVEYRRIVPNVDISLVEDGSGTLLKHVERGLIHLAISAYSSGGELEGKTLFPLVTLAAVPKAHRLSKRKSIDVTDLVNEPVLLLKPGFMTRQLFDGACQVAHFKPQTMIESASPHCLLALAEAGHGIAVIPSTVQITGKTMPIVPLHQEGRQLGLWISAVWDPRRYLPSTAQTFIDVIHRFTRKDYPGKTFRFKNLVDSSTAPDNALAGIDG